MKTIFLHIGTHKTGSTSIQRFLARADEELARQGILYPKTGRPDTDWSNKYGHHDLAWSVSGNRSIDGEQVWGDLRREIGEARGRRVVVSTEEFEGCTSEEIRRIVAHLDSLSIRVIVYLRSPMHYLRSQYKQVVKDGTYSDSFVQFVKELVPRCNYLALISRWEQFDEIESVDVRLFGKAKNNPGLEPSFAEAVGIDFEEVRSFAGSPVNTSPPDHLVRLVRWINAAAVLGEKSETWQALMRRARGNTLSQRWPGKWLAKATRPFLRGSLVTDRAVEMLREELQDAHECFLREYVDPEDRTYLSL